MNPGRLIHTLPGRVLHKFIEDQAPNWAVLIAWNALFALFPIVVFMAAVLGIVAGIIGESRLVDCDTVQSQTSRLDCTLLSVLPSQTVPGAYEAIHHFQDQQGLLIVIGVLGLLWGGSALFGAMEQAFAVIYHTRPRDFLRQKVTGVSMIFLFTVLAGLAILSSVILPALPAIPGAPPLLKTGFSLVLQIGIGLIAGTLLFTSIYFVVPNRHQRLRRVLPGAVLAGALFELVTLVFPTYIALTNSVANYGKTFGLLFVVLTYFFFFGLITMIGVEFNSVLYPEPAAPPVRQPLEPRTIATAPTAQSVNGSRRRIRARTALGLAVIASVIGVLLGRRRAGSD